MIRRFEETTGLYVEKIPGQDRFAFAQTDSSDFYDLIEWAERGEYPGSVILFYDLVTGRVYRPFEKKRNVLFSNPVYADGLLYFLKGDYTEKKITLYRCIPGELLEVVTGFDAADVNFYNLRIIGNPVYVVSQDERFECYYPERLSFLKDERETVMMIEDGKVYLERWVEEGWDEEQECATEDYRYYNKVIVRDFTGQVLSEEDGSLFQAADGTWWIS